MQYFPEETQIKTMYKKKPKKKDPYSMYIQEDVKKFYVEKEQKKKIKKEEQ